MRGLTDKVVVIAGGGSGIGAATARRLVAEGASVVVGDLVGDNAEAVRVCEHALRLRPGMPQAERLLAQLGATQTESLVGTLAYGKRGYRMRRTVAPCRG